MTMTAVAVALLLTVSGPPAGTGEPPPSEPSAEVGAPPDRTAARELFEQGLAAYKAAEYARAIELFERSFELSRAPGLLFNIAQAHRLAGRCAEAHRYYVSYRDAAPTARNRSLTERYIADTAPCATKPPPAPAPSPPPANVGLRAASVRPSKDAAPLRTTPRARALAEIGLLTLAVGGAAAGTFFAVKAERSSDRVSALFDNGGTWDGPVVGADADGPRDAKLSVISFAVAGVCAAATAWLFVAGRRAPAERRP